MKALRKLDKVFLIFGLLLVAVFSVVKLYSAFMSRVSVEKFSAVKRATARQLTMPPDEVSFDLWTMKRVKAYRETLLQSIESPLAILRVPGLKIEVPVLEGTDEFALNRGVGWIQGTAKPGTSGNVGIAGHRDGFFRVLKDVKVGDAMELETLDGIQKFVVDEIEIVFPSDTSVLRARGRPSVTLVTCYPFYFVGDAPQRFIVHASLIDSMREQAEGSLNSQRSKNF